MCSLAFVFSQQQMGEKEIDNALVTIVKEPILSVEKLDFRSIVREKCIFIQSFFTHFQQSLYFDITHRYFEIGSGYLEVRQMVIDV